MKDITIPFPCANLIWEDSTSKIMGQNQTNQTVWYFEHRCLWKECMDIVDFAWRYSPWKCSIWDFNFWLSVSMHGQPYLNLPRLAKVPLDSLGVFSEVRNSEWKIMIFKHAKIFFQQFKIAATDIKIICKE